MYILYYNTNTYTRAHNNNNTNRARACACVVITTMIIIIIIWPSGKKKRHRVRTPSHPCPCGYRVYNMHRTRCRQEGLTVTRTREDFWLFLFYLPARNRLKVIVVVGPSPRIKKPVFDKCSFFFFILYVVLCLRERRKINIIYGHISVRAKRVG